MTRNRFFKNPYRSTYRGKVSFEDAEKQKKYVDDMKIDATFYYLDDIESSVIPYSMLHKIIQKLKTKQNNSSTLQEKAYLYRQNLIALQNWLKVIFHSINIKKKRFWKEQNV